MLLSLMFVNLMCDGTSLLVIINDETQFFARFIQYVRLLLFLNLGMGMSRKPPAAMYEFWGRKIGISSCGTCSRELGSI